MSGFAVVTAASPLLIRLDSGDAELPALLLSSYAPVIGDRIAWVRLPDGLLVLGKVS